jgi:hypothetical protein
LTDPDSASDPALFVSELQDANEKYLFLKDFLLIRYFLKMHLHHSPKIKSYKEDKKTVEIKVFLLFLLDDRRIQIRIRKIVTDPDTGEFQKHTDRPKTYGPRDPDPQHWCQESSRNLVGWE